MGKKLEIAIKIEMLEAEGQKLSSVFNLNFCQIELFKCVISRMESPSYLLKICIKREKVVTYPIRGVLCALYML